MKIIDIEILPHGGAELTVLDVFDCPVWIKGDLTTYPHDPPEFHIEEAWVCIDNKGWRNELSVAKVTDKLSKEGFFDKIFKIIKEG